MNKKWVLLAVATILILAEVYPVYAGQTQAYAKVVIIIPPRPTQNAPIAITVPEPKQPEVRKENTQPDKEIIALQQDIALALAKDQQGKAKTSE